MELASVLRIATPQYGCITRGQFLQVGTEGQLNALVRAGTLRRRWPEVYVVSGFRHDWHQIASGITLSVPGSALSFGAAAKLWGFDIGATSQIEFTTCGSQRYERAGAKHHRSEVLEGFITSRNGVAVTKPARTVVDLSDRLTARQLGALIDKCRILNLANAFDIKQCLDEVGANGRRKSTLLNSALSPRLANDRDIDSFLEKQALEWIRSNGFPEPETQVKCRGNRPYRLDIWYPQFAINIEPNGPWHLLPSINVEDQKRDADLSTRGIIVIRVSLEMEESEFIPLLAAAIASRSKGLAG